MNRMRGPPKNGGACTSPIVESTRGVSCLPSPACKAGQPDNLNQPIVNIIFLLCISAICNNLPMVPQAPPHTDCPPLPHQKNGARQTQPRPPEPASPHVLATAPPNVRGGENKLECCLGALRQRWYGTYHAERERSTADDKATSRVHRRSTP